MRILSIGFLGLFVGWILGKVFFRLYPPQRIYDYVLLEVLSSASAMVLAWYVPKADFSLLAALILSWGLLVLSFIDRSYLLIPNIILWPLWGLGVVFNLFSVLVDPITSILGASVGYMSLWLVATIYHSITGRIGLGQGDIKLLGLIGTWLGIEVLFQVLLIASIAGIGFAGGLLFFKKQPYHTPISFGPFLALGGWLELFTVLDVAYNPVSPRLLAQNMATLSLPG